MAENLSNLIVSLAEKAGIPNDNKQLVELLAHTELNNVKVHIDIVNGLQKNLLSLTDAKNDHPEIKSHYFGETMSNVDRVLSKIYRDYEFDNDEIDELKRESSSTKRIALVAEKIKQKGEAAIAEAKKTAKPNEEVTTLRAEVDKLNQQLAAEKTARTNDVKAHEQKINEIKTETFLSTKIAPIKTVFDTLPPEVKMATIRNLLDKELQDSNAHIVYDDNGNPALKKKDGANFYNEQNQLVTIDGFINQALAKNKSLTNTNPAPPKPGEQQQPPVPGATNTTPGKSIPGLSELVKETEQSFAPANNSPVSLITG